MIKTSNEAILRPQNLGGGGERNSSIELLRILMMLSLIAHHLTVNSGVVEQFDSDNATVIMHIFGMWGKTAINIFTLITGYFLIDRTISVKRILRLAVEIYFYEFLYYLIFTITSYDPFSLKSFAQTVLIVPWETGRYYAGSMIMMMLFIPLVNKGIKALNKKQFGILLCLLLFYYTVLASIHFRDNFDFVIWMLTVYLIGGYMSLYKLKIDTLKIGMIGSIASIVLMIGSIAGMILIFNKVDMATFFVSDANKILAVVASVFIFIMFKNWNLRYNKAINTAASATFGILLLHSCCPAIRKLLWQDIFKISSHFDYSAGSFLYYAGVVLLIFVVAMFIDLLRQRFIEKPFFNFLENRYPKLMNKNLWE